MGMCLVDILNLYTDAVTVCTFSETFFISQFPFTIINNYLLFCAVKSYNDKKVLPHLELDTVIKELENILLVNDTRLNPSKTVFLRISLSPKVSKFRYFIIYLCIQSPVYYLKKQPFKYLQNKTEAKQGEFEIIIKHIIFWSIRVITCHF